MPRHVWAALLALTLGCSTRPLPGEGNSGTSSESESSATTASTSTTGDSESESGATGDGDGDPSTETDTGDPGCEEPQKLDLPPEGEATPDACTIEPIDWPTPEAWPGCLLCEIEPTCAFEAYLGCVTPPEGLACADVCFGGDCIGEFWTSCEGVGPDGWSDTPADVCGVYELDGRCCTIGKFLAFCAE